MGQSRIRMIVADDQPVVLDGLTAIISRQPDMHIVAEGRDWPETIQQVLRHRPDLLLADLHMPKGEAGAAIAAIREQFAAAKIVVFSGSDADEEIYQVLRAGARGYILKDEPREDWLQCIRAVSQDQMWIDSSTAIKLAERIKLPDLTRREKEVLQLVAEGKSNKEIGCTLNVTEGTVKLHLSHVFAKLGVSGRVAAMEVAVRRGLAKLAAAGPLAIRGFKEKGKKTAA
jgi:two-component system NarL family response regulator